MFDSLEYLKKLEGVGFPREQAEVQVNLVAHALTAHFATKQDIAETHHSVRSDFAKLRNEFSDLRDEFADLRDDVNERISSVQGEVARLRKEFSGLQGEFAGLRGEFADLRGGFAESRGENIARFAKIEAQLEILPNQIMIRLGALMVVLMTIGFTAIGLLIQQH